MGVGTEETSTEEARELTIPERAKAARRLRSEWLEAIEKAATRKVRERKVDDKESFYFDVDGRRYFVDIGELTLNVNIVHYTDENLPPTDLSQVRPEEVEWVKITEGSRKLSPWISYTPLGVGGSAEDVTRGPQTNTEAAVKSVERVLGNLPLKPQAPDSL